MASVKAPRVELMHVTPALAAQWLGKNTANRKLNRERAEVMAREMRDGRWRVTHQGIAFGPDDVLLDGQHRLLAVTIAGVAVRMMVTFGLDDVFSSIDCGKVRSASDIEGRNGRTNAVSVVKAARECLSWEHSRWEMASGQFDTAAAVRACARVGDELEAILPSVSALWTLGSKGWWAAFKLVTSRAMPAESAAFLAALQTGAGLASNDPRLALRNRLLDPVASRTFGVNDRIRKLLVLRAWNAFAEGRSLNKIIIAKNSDMAWPEVVGCESVSLGLKDILPR